MEESEFPARRGRTEFSTQQHPASGAGIVHRAKPAALVQLTWKLDHHHADLNGTFTIRSTRKSEDLIFLEFSIDPA